CQTSVTDLRAVNESMGLMTAFLLKGAGCVFSTQWSVYDMCAAPFALDFAQKVTTGRALTGAMNESRERLRRLTPDDTDAMTRAAIGTLRAGGWTDAGVALETRANKLKSALPKWVTDFSNPIFWAAFQLVGRAV